MDYSLTVPCLLGLEGPIADELRRLGLEGVAAENGRVDFRGGAEAIARANINLRIGERVLLELGRFTALSFDELFEGTRALPWETIIPRDGAFPVKGYSLHLDRRAGDEALRLEFQRRRDHGVGEAGDRHQRARARPPGDRIVYAEARQQRAEENQRDGAGRGGVFLFQSQGQPEIQQELTEAADQTSHQEGPEQMLPDRGARRVPLGVVPVFFIGHVHHPFSQDTDSMRSFACFMKIDKPGRIW